MQSIRDLLSCDLRKHIYVVSGSFRSASESILRDKIAIQLTVCVTCVYTLICKTVLHEVDTNVYTFFDRIHVCPRVLVWSGKSWCITKDVMERCKTRMYKTFKYQYNLFILVYTDTTFLLILFQYKSLENFLSRFNDQSVNTRRYVYVKNLISMFDASF